MSEYVYCSDGTPLASAGGEISLPREEIVRCKDCKRWIDDCEWNRFFNDPEIDEPDGFCAWGERRSDAE